MSVLERYADLWIPEPNTGCFLWAGPTTEGYARKQHRLVCRDVLEEEVGPHPEGKHDAAHATLAGCVGAACVNPDHLRWATRSANILDILPEKRSMAAKMWRAERSAEWRAENARKAREGLKDRTIEQRRAQTRKANEMNTLRRNKNG